MNKKIQLRLHLLEKIKPFIGKNIIKVITGQRRVGKSYFLKMLMSDTQKEIIYINKELYEFDFIKNYHNLIKYIEDNSTSNNAAIFIDEIQEIDCFEKALRHFQAKETFDIYCTGSNAKLLSGELATLLSGRYMQFEIHSLSFHEFREFQGKKNLNDYLVFGGMPYLRHLVLEKEIAYQYLKSVYESIVLKDVVERYNLRNVNFLEKLVLYLCNNIGSITSANNISKFLKSQNIKINVSTILNYIEALKNCFFIYEVSRFDIEGKKIFEMNHKYYIEDLGIRNAIVGYNQVKDEGKLLENIVFMHLKRQGYIIYVGYIGNKEIDFVAEKNNEKLYIQVALHVDSEETMQREFGNLLEIKDNYPKYVVTKNASSINSYEGIQHISVTDFFNKIY